MRRLPLRLLVVTPVALALLAGPALAQDPPDSSTDTSTDSSVADSSTTSSTEATTTTTTEAPTTTAAPPTTEAPTTTAAPTTVPPRWVSLSATEAAGRVTVTGQVTNMAGRCTATTCQVLKFQRVHASAWVTLTGTRLNRDGTFQVSARRFGPGPWRVLVGVEEEHIWDQYIVQTSPPVAPPAPPAPPPPGPTPPPSGGGGTAVPANSGSGRRIVYSNSQMRVWVIEGDGSVRLTARVSGKRFVPTPRVYRVFSKSRYTYAIQNPSVKWEFMTRFAHTASGGNVGFHAIPFQFGRPLQSEAQLGQPLSGGCVRMARPNAEFIFGWAGVGTVVVVLP